MKCWGLGLILASAAVAAYWTSFPGAFHYDDFPLLLEEDRVIGDGFDYGAFVDHYGGRPLTLYSFHLNHRWAGASPLSYHGISVALHTLVVLMIFLLVRRWTDGLFVPFAAALLFALHPAQVQAVNYIWSRSVLLMAFFGLLALLGARNRPWLSLAAFQLAIWSRAEALAFLVPLAISNRKLRIPGVLLATVNVAGLGYGLLRHSPAELAWTHPSWLDYWAQALVAFWLYVKLMVWPSGFSIFHGPLQTGPATVVAAAFGVTLLALAAWVIQRERANRPAFLALGWVGLFLAPSLLVPNSDVFNESRIYVALGGFTFLAALLLERVGAGLDSLKRALGVRSGGPVGRWLLAAILAAACLPPTLGRHEVWGDDVALWEEAVRRAGGEAVPHYNLAVALSRRGEIERARKGFETAARLNPEDDMSYAGLGFCAEFEGRWLDALRQYDRALALNPENGYARDAALRIRARLAMGAREP
jgi:protein O-mannosyl-transferase